MHPVFQTDPFQQLLRISTVHLATEHHRHLDVFQSRQVGEQISGIILPDESDRVPLILNQFTLINFEKIPFTHNHLTG
ncbi:hypothetical protein D3C80_2167980 [compost metagenome]